MAGLRGIILGAVALASLLLALHAETSWVRATTSGTFDETVYRQVAHDMASRGTVRPAVDLGVAPLPLLLAWLPGAGPEPTDETYIDQVAAARRRATWFFAVPLAVTAFLWCASACGWFAGTVAAGLLVLSPNTLAHASLATTDACIMAATLITLWVMTWYVRARSLPRALLLGGALAVAIASKYSGIVLVIVAVLSMWLARPGHPPVGARRRRVLDATVFAVAFVALWGLHGWLAADVIPLSGLTPDHLRRFGIGPEGAATAIRVASTPVPAMIRGIVYQAYHDRVGHDAFLLGRTSTHGWWYYFPVALLLKSTAMEVAAFLLFVPAIALSWRQSTPLRTLGIAAAVFVGLSLNSRLNIGVRYVLPLLPIAIVGTVLFAAERLRHRPRTAMAAGVAALAVQAVSATSIAPHYLAYFNVAAGGPAAGYRLLADSNVDWGQDLPSLRAWQTALGGAPIALSYFGTAPLAVYGVEWADWRTVAPESAAPPRWLVVSATHLVGLYLCGDPFQALRPLTPDARIGYSLLAFSLDRSDVRAALVRARQSECAG